MVYSLYYFKLANIPNIDIDLPRCTGVHIARRLEVQRRPIMLIRSGVDATSFNKLLSAGREHAVGGAARTESAVRQTASIFSYLQLRLEMIFELLAYFPHLDDGSQVSTTIDPFYDILRMREFLSKLALLR